MNSIYEIEVMTANDVDVPKRLLIIPDISVFWDGDHRTWTEGAIWSIMSWSDIANENQFFDRIIVASPHLNMDQYRNRSFLNAWEGWANHMSYELWLDWQIYHILAATCHIDNFGMSDADFSGRIKFYAKEFFDCFDRDRAAGYDHDPWEVILRNYFGNSASSSWSDTLGHANSLVEHFERGSTTINTSPNYQGEDDIMNVVILERVDGVPKARAFVLPRRLASADQRS